MHREIDSTKLPAALLRAAQEDRSYLPRLDAIDRRTSEAVAAREDAGDAFMAAILSGTDPKLPHMSMQGIQYRSTVSEYLAESNSDARAVLLSACRYALRSESRQAQPGDVQAAVHLLGQFIRAARDEYAMHQSECYE